MDKKSIIGTGLSGMIGRRFGQLFGEKYTLQNMDLTTGVDITSRDKVMAFVGESKAKTVLHLAAFTDATAANEQDGDEEGLCYRINVQGTRNILSAAVKYDKHLIHVSTDFVFSGNKETAYVETDEPDPIEWYGKTKYIAEQLVGEMMPSAVIVRLSYPYQARPVRPDFVSLFRQRLAENVLPPAFADHIITPTFADDLCQVFDLMIGERPKGIYHVVGSSWHSDYELALKVGDKFGLDGEVRKGNLEEFLKTATRPYQKMLKNSNEKLKTDLGYTMKTFDEGLSEIVRQLEE